MIEPSDADISECPDSVIEYIHELEAENRSFHKDALAFESILNERLDFHKDSEPDFVSGYKLGVRRFEDLYLCGAGKVLEQQYAKEQIKALDSVKAEYDAHEKGGEPISFHSAFLIVQERLKAKVEHELL